MSCTYSRLIFLLPLKECFECHKSQLCLRCLVIGVGQMLYALESNGRVAFPFLQFVMFVLISSITNWFCVTRDCVATYKTKIYQLSLLVVVSCMLLFLNPLCNDCSGKLTNNWITLIIHGLSKCNFDWRLHLRISFLLICTVTCMKHVPIVLAAFIFVRPLDLTPYLKSSFTAPVECLYSL